MTITATESTFEQSTIERLLALGYRYQHGSTIARAPQAVVLTAERRAYLEQRYGSTELAERLPAFAIEQAIEQIRAPAGVNLERRNLLFHRMLRDGFTLRYEVDHRPYFEQIYLANFEQPTLNEFLVVNQLSIDGSEPGHRRRPDLIIYINGLPLVVFELKSPWDAYADVGGAFKQLGHLEDLTNLCYGTLADDDSLREDFLHEEHRLSKVYSLISHLPVGRDNTDEVAFYQLIRKQVRKLDPAARSGMDDLDRAVQDLLNDSIAAQPAVDIFRVAGLERPDISIYKSTGPKPIAKMSRPVSRAPSRWCCANATSKESRWPSSSIG